MTEGGRSAWQGIEVRHLAALLALAEESSFNRAARRLGYSQPAVSQQLAALERIVGRQLVNRPRASQPLSLTDAGERLLVHARAIQTNLALAEADLDTTAAAHLRIGTYQTIAAHLLPHVLRELSETAPGVDVVLTDTPGDERLVSFLHQGELDLAFVDLPLRFQGELKTEALAKDDYVLVLPRSSQRASQAEPIRFAELSELKLIGFKSSGSTQRVITHLRNRGIELQFALRSDDNSMIQGFVAAGFGAALIPGLAADLLSRDLAVLTFESPLPPRVIGLAWVRELEVSSPAAAFVSSTRSVVARLWGDREITPADELEARRERTIAI
jgi:DNA-binding transcriptional LysR family regulator